MDTLFISDLKLNTRIGVYDWERSAPQIVLFDIELKSNFLKAAKSCLLKDTIDYAQLCIVLQDFALHKHFDLVETLAEEMAQLILSQYPVSHLRLKLNKINALSQATGVGIIIERTK